MKKGNFTLNMLLNLPTPTNITNMWNFGSLLGISLMIQILTGLLLSCHYMNSIDHSFDSIIHIVRNVYYGWMMRFVHANGASLYFIFMYMHIGRNIFYKSYRLIYTWYTGTTIFLLSMAIAFLGYVLPWGQMSFWGATVITNLLSVIPYLGTTVTQWIWGSFAIDAPTLSRFFVFHFFLPLAVSALAMVHLIFLHSTGSTNPLGLVENHEKLTFHPFFLWKDLVSIIVIMAWFIILFLLNPYSLMDAENFIMANPMTTPPHIKPEWYYLFAYAILRSIPNKMGGVIMLLMSVLILYALPLSKNKLKEKNPVNSLNNILFFWLLTMVFLILTWIGGNPVQYPYILTGQIFTFLYFFFFILIMF